MDGRTDGRIDRQGVEGSITVDLVGTEKVWDEIYKGIRDDETRNMARDGDGGRNRDRERDRGSNNDKYNIDRNKKCNYNKKKSAQNFDRKKHEQHENHENMKNMKNLAEMYWETSIQ